MKLSFILFALLPLVAVAQQLRGAAEDLELVDEYDNYDTIVSLNTLFLLYMLPPSSLTLALLV